MKGYRKILLGFFYLGGMFILTGLEIARHPTPDLTGLGVLAGGLAAGLGTIIWGNVQEHRSEDLKSTAAPIPLTPKN